MAGRCNASQDAQDAWDAENTALASGRNGDGSDAGSVFADESQEPHNTQSKLPFARQLQQLSCSLKEIRMTIY